jgi:hypothetical protein
MSKSGITLALLAASLVVGLSLSVTAQVTDPEMTCAAYLKQVATSGGTPKSGDAATDKMAADVDKKMADYCTAHPTEKAMDAAMKALGG